MRAAAGQISPTRRRGGYAVAALRAITDFGWQLPWVNRIELYVEPRNTGSWRTAESAGYELEGLLRSWRPVGGELRDMYMYAVVRHGHGKRATQ